MATNWNRDRRIIENKPLHVLDIPDEYQYMGTGTSGRVAKIRRCNSWTRIDRALSSRIPFQPFARDVGF